LTKKADDTVFAAAKKKLGEAIEKCDATDVDKLVKLMETLAKLKVAESKGAKDGDEWGAGLK
jgi:hypothetical protein